jgi:hypothetical protein
MMRRSPELCTRRPPRWKFPDVCMPETYKYYNERGDMKAAFSETGHACLSTALQLLQRNGIERVPLLLLILGTCSQDRKTSLK